VYNKNVEILSQMMHEPTFWIGVAVALLAVVVLKYILQAAIADGLEEFERRKQQRDRERREQERRGRL
jgi:hypothetical protein